MGQARTRLKARGGIDLPPVHGALGRKISEFWTEVFHREQREKLEVLNYLPALIYTMSGVPVSVPADKREEILNPFRDNFEKVLTQQAYTSEHLRKKLAEKVRRLEQQKDMFSRLDMMEDQSFVAEWMKGRV